MENDVQAKRRDVTRRNENTTQNDGESKINIMQMMAAKMIFTAKCAPAHYSAADWCWEIYLCDVKWCDFLEKKKKTLAMTTKTADVA